MFQTVGVVLLTFVLGADSTEAAAPSSERPVITRDGSGQTIIRATRISTPPRADGRLDDGVW